MGSALDAPTVDRLAQADLLAAVARLEGSPLAAEGKIGLIGLDAVRERLGERWASKQAQVHEQVERTLGRHLGVDAWWARISETDYILVQPSLSRYAAQASCLNYMRSLLEHLLGKFSAADLRVSEVTALSPTGVKAQPLDPQAVNAAAETERRQAALARPADEAAIFNAANPFMAAGGERLRVSCRLDPVFRLCDYVQVGYRLTRNVIDERSGMVLSHEALSRLTTTDLEKVDLATLARGFNRLRSEQSEGQGANTLTLPVAFSTLASLKARRALVASLQSARRTTAVKVYCAINRLEGAPPNALYTAVGMMRPFCEGVIGGVEKPQRSAAALVGSGLAGIAFDYVGPSGEDMERMSAALGPAVDAATAVSKLVIVLGLKSPRELGIAGLLGASHATLRAPEPAV